MVGYGGAQFTPNAWGAGTPAAKKFAELGGVRGMLDIRNQLAMAKFLYDAAGKQITPWYGTRYVQGQNDHYRGSVKAEDVLAKFDAMAAGKIPPAVAAAVGTPGDGGGFLSPILDAAARGLVWIALIIGGAAAVVIGFGRATGQGQERAHA